jgi:hypothetical protein
MLLFSTCQGTVGPQGPAAPAGKAPEEPKASTVSIVSGGLMYDKWWKVADGATEPTEDSPLLIFPYFTKASVTTT